MDQPANPPKPDFSFLVGVWEIIDCGLETARGDSYGVLGTIFELTADGEVQWKLPENYIEIPVFSCETYEAVARGPFLTMLIRFGSYKGHVIEFRIEKFNTETQIMTIHEGLLYMHCKKLVGSFSYDNAIDEPFSLWPACEQGYFTDLTITTSDNTKFAVHACILKILTPDIDWRAQPTPLSGLPHRITRSIIHYMYTYSLPPDLTLEEAHELISTSSNVSGLEDLQELCKTFIKNVSLAREMASLMAEVQSLFRQATDHFSERTDSHSLKEPPILCSAVRNALRDIAVATAKIMLFCDTYNKRKNEFSQKGAHEIIRYTKSRIPFFVSQVTTFVQLVKTTFSTLTTTERHELACYLIPDAMYIFDTLITLLLRTQEFFETVLLRLGPEDNSKYRLKMHNFNEHMQRINHKKELNKIRLILHRIECFLHHLKKKRDRFRNLNSENKVRTLIRNIDHIIERLPFLFMRLEETTEELEQKSEWIESQFCFKISTAKVGGFLSILMENREVLQMLLSTLCDVVRRDDFTRSVISLGILDYARASDFINFNVDADDDISPEDDIFDLGQFLWQSPPSSDNALCRNALQRLIDGVETDMVFQITPSDFTYNSDDENYSDINIAHFTDDESDYTSGEGQAFVSVDAKVEDASTAPFGAEDASSTDRGSDSEATASTGTESACPNNTEAEGAGSNLEADSATPLGTKTGDEVPTEKHTDGPTGKSRSREYEVPAEKSDGATHARKGKEDGISTDKQIDGARRGASKAEDEIPARGTDSAVRPKRYKDGARRGGRKADEIPATKTYSSVRPKRYGEEGSTSEEQICGVRRRTRNPENTIPAVRTYSEVRPIRNRDGGSSDDEEIGGARRRIRKLEDEILAYRTFGSVRPRRYGDERGTPDEEIGGVRRRTRKRDQIPAVNIDSGVLPRRYGDEGNTPDEEIGGVRRRTRKREDQIPAVNIDSGVLPRRYGDEGNTSDEEIGGVRRRTRKREDQIPALKVDSGVLPRRYGDEGNTSDEEIGGVRRRTRKREDQIPAVNIDSGVLPRRYGDEGNTPDEEIGGVRRRTRKREDQIPALKVDSGVLPRRYGDEGNTSDEEIGGVRRRTRKREDQIPALKTDDAVRPKRDKEDFGFAGLQIDDARRSASKAEDKISAVRTGNVARQKQGKIGVASAKKEVDEAACVIAERAGFGEREEEGAACATAGSVVSSIEREKEKEEGAACAFTKGDSKGIARRRKRVEEKETVTFKAHRAIVATRCPVFKRALLSGMQEDVNCRIDVRDISPTLFPFFLNYLYTGIMDYASLTPRQITEMFFIADCYELYPLKEGCEKALKVYIDDSSVFLFFRIADGYNASILKDACKKYIKENPKISLDNDLFDELSRKLKNEVCEIISCAKRGESLANEQHQESCVAGACAAAAGGETQSETWNIPRVDIEDTIPSTDTIRFRWGLEQLRDIVGPTVPRSTLVQVLLAADCDVNRALNYYYAYIRERQRTRAPRRN